MSLSTQSNLPLSLDFMNKSSSDQITTTEIDLTDNDENIQQSLSRIQYLLDDYMNDVLLMNNIDNASSRKKNQQDQLEIDKRTQHLIQEASTSERRAANIITQWCRVMIIQKRNEKYTTGIRAVLKSSGFIDQTIDDRFIPMDNTHTSSAVCIQKHFRSRLVRQRLHGMGCKPKPRSQNWTSLQLQSVADFVIETLHQKRLHERNELISGLNKCDEVLETAMSWCRDKVMHLNTDIQNYDYSSSFDANQFVSLDGLSSQDQNQYMKLQNDLSETKSKICNEKKYFIESFLNFIEIFEKNSQSYLKNRMSSLKTIEQNYNHFNDLISFIDNTKPSADDKYVEQWLESEQEKMNQCQIECDVQQEIILIRERKRIENEIRTLLRLFELLDSILGYLTSIYNWEAEKLSSHYHVLMRLQTTDESLKHVDRINFLLTKINYTRYVIIPGGWNELDKMCKQQEREMEKLEISFVDNQINSFNMENWYTVYNNKPWLRNRLFSDSANKLVEEKKRVDIQDKMHRVMIEKKKLEADEQNAKLSNQKIREYQIYCENPELSYQMQEELRKVCEQLQNMIDIYESTKQVRLDRILDYEEYIKSHSINKSIHDDGSHNDSFWKSKQQYATERRNHLIAQEKALDFLTKQVDNFIDWSYLNHSFDIPSISKSRASVANLLSLARSKHESFTRKANKFLTKSDNDPELRLMMTNLRKNMKKQNALPQAVTSLFFTVGEHEKENFCKLNDLNKKDGLSFYQNTLVLGTYNHVNLWIQTSSNEKEFITDIEIETNSKDSECYHRLCANDYYMISHNELNVGVWVKRRRDSSYVIKNMGVCYSEDEKSFLSNDSCIIGNCLSNFDLARAYIWCIKGHRSVKEDLIDIKKIRKELSDCEKLLAENPSDFILKGIVEKLRLRLVQESSKEKSFFNDYTLDHVTYVTEFLALSENDLSALNVTYREIDRNHDGFIDVDELLKFLDEPKSFATIIDKLIEVIIMDKSKFDTKLNFGLTIRMIATYVMFSSKEVLKFLFNTYRDSNLQVISTEIFINLLESMNVNNQKGAILKALRDLERHHGGELSFEAFQDLNQRYPALLFPMFRFQEKLKIVFLGEKWWKNKIFKYAKAMELVSKELLRE